MKKFISHILKISFFSVIILLGTFLLISISTRFTKKIESLLFQFGTLNGKLKERSIMFKEWVNIESENKILFLGASSMYRNYNPEYLPKNYDGFNLGTSGMNIKIQEEIVKSFLNSNIDIFVLEVTPVLWSLRRYETRKNWIQDWVNPKDKVVRKIAFESKRLKEYFQYLYSLIKFHVPSKYYPLKSKTRSQLSKKGSDCIIGVKPFELSYQDYVFNLSKENHSSLINLSRIKKKKILFVINPIRELNYTLNNFPVNVIDFNDFIKLNDEHFVDEVHLNCSGMNQFSLEASKIIVSILERDF